NGAAQSNVLPFNRVGTCQLQHPTQKPVDLLAYLIARSTHEGGLVADPFMGSGSTCLAARATRRRYLGIELDQQWYELALQRMARRSGAPPSMARRGRGVGPGPPWPRMVSRTSAGAGTRPLTPPACAPVALVPGASSRRRALVPFRCRRG